MLNGYSDCTLHYILLYEYFKSLAIEGENQLVMGEENIEAQYFLGLIYKEGRGPDQTINLKNAFDWFYKASLEGHTESTYELALILKNGVEGVEQTFVLALNYFKMVADKGHVEAMYNAGDILYHGKGEVTKNFKEAFRYFQMAADLRHPGSMYYLGHMNYYGEGIEKKESGIWYELAEKERSVLVRDELNKTLINRKK